MSGGIRRPALISHAFFTAEQAWQDGSEARGALTGLWERARSRNMSDPVRPGWPVDLPARPPEPGRFTVLAARQRSGDGVLQAVAYRLHDIVGFALFEAPNNDAATWADLDSGLRQHVGTGFTRGIVGSVTLRLGLWPRLRKAREGSVPAIARLTCGQGEWTRSWYRPAGGLILWELPPPADTPVTVARGLLALADVRDEELLERWAWRPAGASGPPRLTRYLLHAAKLRYHGAFLDTELGPNADTIRRTDEQRVRLADLLDDENAPADRLIAADRALGRLQSDQHGLISRLTMVRDMANTVEIAQDNMAAALGLPDTPPDAPPGAATGGPVDSDRQVARWTREQLRAEEAYLASARLRAAEVTRLTSPAVASRLQQRKEQLTLLQTSLIGAIVMVLAAIQGLQYDVPLRGYLKAPVVFLLGATALLLPAALFPHPRHILGRPWVDRLVTGSFGAAAGWLAATAAFWLAGDRPAPPWVSVGVAFACTVLAIVTVRVRRG